MQRSMCGPRSVAICVVSQEDVFSTWLMLIPALVLAKWKRRSLGSRQNSGPHDYGVSATHTARRERLAPGVYVPRGYRTTVGISQVEKTSSWLTEVQGLITTGYVKPPARVVRGGQCGWPTPRSHEDHCFVVSQEDVFSTWLIPALVLAMWKRRPLGSRQSAKTKPWMFHTWVCTRV